MDGIKDDDNKRFVEEAGVKNLWSDARDNLEARQALNQNYAELTNSKAATLDGSTTIFADTKKMDVTVENPIDNTQKIDLGLEQRPQTKLTLHKDINSFKVTLSLSLIHIYYVTQRKTLDTTWPQIKNSRTDDLKNSINAGTINMTAFTNQMVVNLNDNGTNVKNVDFGIEKRPETKIELTKTINKIKITLSNGTVLMERGGDSLPVVPQYFMDEELIDVYKRQILDSYKKHLLI